MTIIVEDPNGPNPPFARIRGYDSDANRRRAIGQLRRHGWNYFVKFKDVKSEFALQIGHAPWVPQGFIHVNQ